MRAFVATNILGVFAFDEKGNLLEKVLFPKNPEEIAERLAKVRAGEIIKEEHEVLRAVKARGAIEVIWDKKAKSNIITTVCEPDNKGKSALQDQFRGFAMQFKWATTQSELNEILTKVNILLTKVKMKVEKKDKILMRAVAALDEIDKELNTFSELLREWYGLYFPEAVTSIKSNEKLSSLLKHGKREELPDKSISGMSKNTSGMEFSEDDLKAVSTFAESIESLFKRKKDISDYIEEASKEAIPNMTAVAGAVIACRLLNLAGGLEKMARMPSSTIQLLGAEKALFRHLKEKTKAPKYGVLFAHPFIQQAPHDKRGKVARLISSKLSLAARTDFFSKEDRSEDFSAQLEKSVKPFLK
jgi:nucleolar protein 56